MMPRVPRPKWFRFVRPGDVLQAPSGRYRVVRKVTHRRGKLYAIQFVKLARSRYPSATTIYFGHEIARFRYVGARVRLDQPLDRRIACTIAREDGKKSARCQPVTQDDVVGVVVA